MVKMPFACHAHSPKTSGPGMLQRRMRFSLDFWALAVHWWLLTTCQLSDIVDKQQCFCLFPPPPKKKFLTCTRLIKINAKPWWDVCVQWIIIELCDNCLDYWLTWKWVHVMLSICQTSCGRNFNTGFLYLSNSAWWRPPLRFYIFVTALVTLK